MGLTKQEKHDTASIEEDLDFQRSSWKVQRVAWIVMLGISVSALLGLFGEGPLSNAHVGSEQSGLQIDYERFVRQESPGTRRTPWNGCASPGSTAEVWIERKWLAEMESNDHSEPEAVFWSVTGSFTISSRSSSAPAASHGTSRPTHRPSTAGSASRRSEYSSSSRLS